MSELDGAWCSVSAAIEHRAIAPGAPEHVRKGQLADIVENFELGTRTDDATVIFDARAMRTLKIMADAESFDHAPEFISMCLDIAALNADASAERFELVSIG